MKTVVIEGQLRTGKGRKASRDLRAQGLVPAVIYGGAENVNFSAPTLAFRDIVYTPDFMEAEIKVDGKTYNCILKDLQFDVVTDTLTHVDFQELVEDRKVLADIPVKFVGQAAGVRAGGRFEAKMKRLRVHTYPKYLTEKIEVDVTNLELNGNIRVEDIHLEHIEIMNSPRQPICSVALTRTLKQAGTDATVAAPAAKK